MKKSKRTMAMLALCLFAVSCQSPVTPSLPLNDLLRAPLAVEINSCQLTLETFLYRDFMPGENSGGSLLIANAYLTAADGQPFPAEIDSDRIWVVNGEEIWETTFTAEARPRDSLHLNQLGKTAWGGPRWDVGAQVEVVVRVTSSMGPPRLLRATKQAIGQTW
ncbi:MAG: hypothetical protein IH583_10430 [Candidatus Aminicenantes bacterium]|nr:hypothetical protein [Candidatus Aminicenantes bacterium]